VTGRDGISAIPRASKEAERSVDSAYGDPVVACLVLYDHRLAVKFLCDFSDLVSRQPVTACRVP
jgi:hypothetical protein